MKQEMYASLTVGQFLKSIKKFQLSPALYALKIDEDKHQTNMAGETIGISKTIIDIIKTFKDYQYISFIKETDTHIRVFFEKSAFRLDHIFNHIFE